MPEQNFNIFTGLNVGNIVANAQSNSLVTSGNITAGNISVTSAMSGDSLTVVDLTVSNVGTLGNANITTGNIGT